MEEEFEKFKVFERWVRSLESRGIRVLRSFYGVDFVLRTSFGEAIVTASIYPLSSTAESNSESEYGIAEIRVLSTEKRPEDFKRFVFEVKRLLGLKTTRIKFSRMSPNILQEKIEKLKERIESQPPVVFFEWEVERAKRIREATKYPEALSKIADSIHADITGDRNVDFYFQKEPGKEVETAGTVIRENGKIVGTIEMFFNPAKGDMFCDITVYDRDLFEEVKRVYEYIASRTKKKKKWWQQ
jgi:hypothetical protein